MPAFFLINLILFPVRRNNFQCFSVGFTRYRYRMTIVASIVKPRRPHTLFDIAGRISPSTREGKILRCFHNKHEPPPSTRPSLTFLNSKIFIFTCCKFPESNQVLHLSRRYGSKPRIYNINTSILWIVGVEAVSMKTDWFDFELSMIAWLIFYTFVTQFWWLLDVFTLFCHLSVVFCILMDWKMPEKKSNFINFRPKSGFAKISGDGTKSVAALT